jgi:hypothetical protein
VERSGRIAISGIPLARCAMAFQFASNYKKQSVDWDGLPFATAPSAEFGIPVPDFATSVKELEVVKVHRIGVTGCSSRELFVMKYMPGGFRRAPYMAFYQFWRTQGNRAKLRASVAGDLVRKRGL